ncbi:MAG TPA: ABC transporter ATP-binding protein [Dehalococcoidia bacterium]|nr:ABC transporter ATP-binding protein [Dehalococcoidia bacterium]
MSRAQGRGDLRGAGLRGARNGDSGNARPQRPAWPTLRRAIGLMANYRLALFGYFAAIVAASLLGLVPPLLIKAIIDGAIPDGSGGRLDLLVVAMAAAILASSLVGIGQSYLSNTIGQGVMFDLRQRLYEHLSGMSISWFTANRTGETLSRVNNDVGSIQGVISDTFGSLLSNLLTLGTTLALVVFLDWRLALFSMIFIPLFIVPARRVGNIQRDLQRHTQEQMAAMSSHMQETLSVSGALLMKTFGRRSDEAALFSRTAGEIRDLNVRRAMVGRWFWMVMGLFGTVGPAVVYWYGGHRVIGAETSVGTVVALAALLPRLFGPTASLVNINVTVLNSVALFERIFDYLDLRHEIKDEPGALVLSDVRGDVEFRDVGFAYVKGQPVLQDLSFQVPAGKFAALVGTSGAGKTTIVNLLARLYDVDSGAVLLDGVDVREVTLESLAGSLGMVDQEPFLFHASLRDNLRYAREDATDEEVEAAATAARIHDFIAELPRGYDTVVGERGYRLSGGEKQRVAVARAILKDPAVLILDEATSNVDALTEAQMQDALRHATRGRTVLAIAHRLSTILAADIILVIDAGRVVESGTHDELIALGGHYAHLYERQFRRGVAEEVELAAGGVD